jgi:hypothetical protein
MPRHPAVAEVDDVENPTYEFRVRGRLGEGVLATFEGLEAEIEPVETVLRGDVSDQAALHRILEQIRSLGLELVEVRRVGGEREPIIRAPR